jgi:hypothetical protein
VPQLPPDTTAVVWNWHWSCADAAPPSASVTGVTVCMSCNIAIAIRVASPGDSGGVVQTTGVGLAAAAVNAAATMQSAAQAVLPPHAPAAPEPVQQPPPVVVAPVAPLPPVPLDPLVAAPPMPAAPAVTIAPGVTATFAVGGGDVRTLATPGASADDAPRLGAQHGFTWGTATTRLHSSSYASAGARVSSAGTSRSSVSVAVAGSSVSIHEHQSTGRAAGATPRKRGPVPPPQPSAPLLPSVPTPIVLAPTAGGSHSTGNFTIDALAAGAAAVLLLILLAYAAPGLQTVRSRFAHVHPDPPG